MDFEPAEPASSRRSLLGTAGLAGLAGAAAAVLAGGASATAAAPEPAPTRPTDSDREALRAALGLELAAVELYRAAAFSLPAEFAAIATLMADQHDAYVDSISGEIGASSSEVAVAGVADDLMSAFTTTDPQAFGAAARTLENTAVATHTELLGAYDSIHAIEVTASIITVESRHATVLTSLAGFSNNLDEMLGNNAEPLSLTGGAA